MKGFCSVCKKDVLADDKEIVTYTIVDAQSTGRQYETHLVHKGCNGSVEINFNWRKARTRSTD